MTRAAHLVVALAMTAGGACGIDWTVPKPRPDAGEAGAGGGGRGGAPGTTGSSADKAESSSSGKPTECDQTGDCAACVQCAQNGKCAEQIQQCLQSQPCSTIAMCAAGCTDPQGQADCVDKCIQEAPDGAKEFGPVLDCVVCSMCPGDCKELVVKYCV